MSQKGKITKAVIAAAGTGTRFLPATKNQPKEMLPIIDKPIIHYLVEEAVNSGISDIILVTRAGNHIMEDYFDNRSELEQYLKDHNKLKYLEIVQQIPQMANFIYVRQKNHLPYGNASPLLAVKDLIDDDEAFVYMFGDDMTLSNGVPVTKQLMNAFDERSPSVVLGVQEVSWDVIDRYGQVRYKEGSEYPYSVAEICEKYPRDKAPSNKAQFGRFIFNYDIVDYIENAHTGNDDELWLTDAITDLIKMGNEVIAPPIKGEWLTTGDPLNYLMTSLKFAMEREDLKDKLTDFINNELLI